RLPLNCRLFCVIGVCRAGVTEPVPTMFTAPPHHAKVFFTGGAKPFFVVSPRFSVDAWPIAIPSLCTSAYRGSAARPDKQTLLAVNVLIEVRDAGVVAAPSTFRTRCTASGWVTSAPRFHSCVSVYVPDLVVLPLNTSHVPMWVVGFGSVRTSRLFPGS